MEVKENGLIEILAIFRYLKNELPTAEYQFLDSYCTCPREMAIFQEFKGVHGDIPS